MVDPLVKSSYTDWFNQTAMHDDAKVAAAYERHYGKPLETDQGSATKAWVKAMADGRSRTALTSGGVMPVPDTGSGNHSYFARAFMNVLQDNDRLLEGQRLFQEVATSLALGSMDAPLAQMPEYAPIRYAGHESGEFFFLPKGSRAATGP